MHAMTPAEEGYVYINVASSDVQLYSFLLELLNNWLIVIFLVSTLLNTHGSMRDGIRLLITMGKEDKPLVWVIRSGRVTTIAVFGEVSKSTERYAHHAIPFNESPTDHSWETS